MDKQACSVMKIHNWYHFQFLQIQMQMPPKEALSLKVAQQPGLGMVTFVHSQSGSRVNHDIHGIDVELLLGQQEDLGKHTSQTLNSGRQK